MWIKKKSPSQTPEYLIGYRAGKVYGFKKGQEATKLFYDQLIKKNYKRLDK